MADTRFVEAGFKRGIGNRTGRKTGQSVKQHSSTGRRYDTEWRCARISDADLRGMTAFEQLKLQRSMERSHPVDSHDRNLCRKIKRSQTREEKMSKQRAWAAEGAQ